ncbi:MAG: MBL fold metallo-hydrolase [Cyanobacteria bacterium]|nr:MBL fold metallo-hydrolase [Cyanobacteriota bacterium]
MKLTFLGQSGFVLAAERTIVIDPFLGDLEDPAERAQHPRLFAPPLSGSDLANIDLVLVSHHHGDHCHIRSLVEIARQNPECVFVTTKSSAEMLTAAGFPMDRVTVPEFPGQVASLHIPVWVVPAAHYDFSHRADTVFDYFGFVVKTGSGAVYFAGDTIPYVGQAGMIRRMEVDLAILPVNGRDRHRDEQGIIGNMDATEAAKVARESGVRCVLPCHFGMFASNTVDPNVVDRILADECGSIERWMPVVGSTFHYSTNRWNLVS